MKKTGLRFIFKLLPVLSAIAAVLAVLGSFWARDIGAANGTIIGTAVGTAVGSWEGITKGMDEGKEAGIEEGLSAADTKTIIQNEIKETGKLEVLLADVTLHNTTKTGEDPSYESVEVICGDAVFSVDLEKTVFEYDETSGIVRILLPKIEVNLELDMNTSEILYTIQKPSVVGAGAGVKAVLNSYKQISGKVEETIGNYEYLIETAKRSAVEQVGQLAEAFSLEGYQYEIGFSKE